MFASSVIIFYYYHSTECSVKPKVELWNKMVQGINSTGIHSMQRQLICSGSLQIEFQSVCHNPLVQLSPCTTNNPEHTSWPCPLWQMTWCTSSASGTLIRFDRLLVIVILSRKQNEGKVGKALFFSRLLPFQIKFSAKK